MLIRKGKNGNITYWQMNLFSSIWVLTFYKILVLCKSKQNWVKYTFLSLHKPEVVSKFHSESVFLWWRTLDGWINVIKILTLFSFISNFATLSRFDFDGICKVILRKYLINELELVSFLQWMFKFVWVFNWNLILTS